jgi:hypothetical protein
VERGAGCRILSPISWWHSLFFLTANKLSLSIFTGRSCRAQHISATYKLSTIAGAISLFTALLIHFMLEKCNNLDTV